MIQTYNIHLNNVEFSLKRNAYLGLLLIEVVNDDTNEEVESEKGAKNNENNKI